MRKITIVATPTAVTKDDQCRVILVLTLENVSGSEIHTCRVQNVIIKWTNCEPMGTEIEGGIIKHKQWPLKKWTIKKKDPVWYATGINKLIDRYKKYLTRYGNYVEK